MLTTKKIRTGIGNVFVALWMLLASVTALAAGVKNGRIVFTSDRTGSWQIYTMNPDGSDQVQVTNLAPTADDLLSPGISPDGTKIVFAYDTGSGPDLYVIDANGGGLRQLTDDHGSFIPRWSPDGKKIIFAGTSKLGTAVIATMAANGSGKRKILTTDFWDSIGGIYTPDGKQIVFYSSMEGLVSAVWIMNADGSNQRRLTHPALMGFPWGVCPDGKHILLQNHQNSPPALSNGIFVMNLDGSGLKHLSAFNKFHHDVYPSCSPDGLKVSFLSDRFSSDVSPDNYGTFDILTINMDGSNLTDIAPAAGSCPHDGNCVTPVWGMAATGR